VRGVAAIALRAGLGDWVRDPGGLLAQAREMGMVRTPGFPRDMGEWSRELRLLDAATAARRLRDRPLLVVHGVDDTEVPVDSARDVADAAPACELRLVPGAGHELRHDPRAIATLLGWLERQV
jgi:putative redox protein